MIFREIREEIWSASFLTIADSQGDSVIQGESFP
jgi:hypothetical protein